MQREYHHIVHVSTPQVSTGPVCENPLACFAVLAVLAVVALTWSAPFIPWTSVEVEPAERFVPVKIVSFGPFVACMVDTRPMVKDECYHYSPAPGELQFVMDGRLSLGGTTALVAVQTFSLIAAIMCPVGLLFCLWTTSEPLIVIGCIVDVLSRVIALSAWMSVVSDGGVWNSRTYGREYTITPNSDWLTMINSGFTMQLVALLLELVMGAFGGAYYCFHTQ